MEKAKRTRVAQMTREVLTGLFVANLSGAILQAVYTWMILDLMGVKCVYLYALTCAFFKTAPFASTWLVGLVASIQLFLQEWKKCVADQESSWTWPLLQASILLLIYSYVDNRLATDILLRQLTWSDPTVLTMSVFLGLYAFGPAGILYGPLLVSMGSIFYHASKELRPLVSK